MKKIMIVFLFAVLINTPVLAEVLDKNQLKQCADLAETIERLQETREIKRSRMRRADRVMRSYGCYKFGGRWKCSNLTPEQNFNVQMANDAHNSASEQYNRATRKKNRLASKFNSSCTGPDLHGRAGDIEEACFMNDSRFCNQFD